MYIYIILMFRGGIICETKVWTLLKCGDVWKDYLFSALIQYVSLFSVSFLLHLSVTGLSMVTVMQQQELKTWNAGKSYLKHDWSKLIYSGYVVYSRYVSLCSQGLTHLLSMSQALFCLTAHLFNNGPCHKIFLLFLDPNTVYFNEKGSFGPNTLKAAACFATCMRIWHWMLQSTAYSKVWPK